MNYSYKPSGVCAQNISFDIDGDKITNVNFLGGCNGNLKAISKLVDGMTVDEIENKLLGNTCGFKPTSCADQLAKAVRQAYESAKSE
ncbi:MAG: TIGR03905 family TSCPD domain-containing protein [Clostridiaceae bacterium]|nr:TIGR03905 family TSCPD domain-containing protein [Clostridiaceae bacterium]